MHSPLALAGASVVLVVVAACSGATTTPFARAAQDGAGTLTAAAATLSDVHAGHLTREYATTTLHVLASQLETLPDELRSADGAPDNGTAERAAGDAEAAVREVEDPCLDAGCDWQGQTERLKHAAAALTSAAGS